MSGPSPATTRPKPSSPSSSSHILSAWALLAVAYSIAAQTSPIQDCDEVFNYYEPTHYLTDRHGLETWEYSPVYAIRSWAYAGLHAGVVRLHRLAPVALPGGKMGDFFALRLVLGLVSATCATRLYGIIAARLGTPCAMVFGVIMGTSAGMSHASVAYLPSAFAMNCSMLGFAAFLDKRPRSALGIMWFGLGAVVGWPFSALLVLPFVVEDVQRSLTARMSLSAGFHSLVSQWLKAVSGCLVMLACVCCVDTFFYHKVVLVPLNIVLYNVFAGAGKGPDIYGTEPWHFYAKNLFINFNFWFLLALGSLPLVWLSRLHKDIRTYPLVPFYLWFFFMSSQAHKEERFMYPIYPALALNASTSVLSIDSLFTSWLHALTAKKSVHSLTRVATRFAIVAFVLLSLLRTYALVEGYGAPLHVYKALTEQDSPVRPGDTVCLGKEWYRFPSSYFLPSGARAKFIRSEFSGLLPGEFWEGEGEAGLWPAAHMVPPGMNDMNVADVGKYVDVSTCTYLVDSLLESMPPTRLEPAYIRDTDTWAQLRCEKFLDAGSTPLLQRLFWVPERLGRKYGEYCLLKRKESPGAKV